MAQCKSCKAFRPSDRDTWDCHLCDTPICDQCYVEHTDREHFVDLYPELHKKRQTRCDETNPLDSETRCDQMWGHTGPHACSSQRPDLPTHHWLRS